MAKCIGNHRERDAKGHFVKRSGNVVSIAGEQNGKNKPSHKRKELQRGDDKGDEKLSAREKVKRAQIEVLDKVSEILTGNCKSAADGNYNCAKFVLDWSGVSDIRTPLAKAPHKKSVTSMLLKRLNEVAEQQEKEEPETAR